MNKLFSSALVLGAGILFVFNGSSAKAQSGNNCSSGINIALSTTGSTCLNNQVGSNSASIWYKFTALRSVTNFEITFDPSQSGTISSAHVFTGACNNLIELGAIVDQHDQSLKVFLDFLSSGQTYYIKLDKSGTNTVASFTICSSAATQLPWQVTGSNTQFDGYLGVGMVPSRPLDIAGDAGISGTLNAGAISTSTFSVTGNTLLGGDLSNTTFSGTGRRMLYTDGNGKVLPLAAGTTGQVLFGDGNWGNLPAIPAALWTASGNNILSNGGNVGINTSSPGFPLDVNGDARVSGTLYVGNGVVIGNQALVPNPVIVPNPVYINAAALHTRVIDADTIRMDSLSRFTGQANFTGEANFQRDVELVNKLTVGGNTSISGNLRVTNLISGQSLSEVYADQNGNLKLGSGGGGGNSQTPLFCSPGSLNWTLGGNNIASFIQNGDQPAAGTCDQNDFILKAFNTKYIWLKTDGKVGIGTSSPTTMLDIQTGGTKDGLRILNGTTAIFSVDVNGSTTINDLDPVQLNPLLTMTHSNGSTLRLLANGTGDIASSHAISLHFGQAAADNFSIFQGVPGFGIKHFYMAGGTGSSYFRTTDPTANNVAFMVVNNPNASGTGQDKEVVVINNDGSTLINSTSNTNSPLTIKNPANNVFQVDINGNTQINSNSAYMSGSGPNSLAMKFDGVNGLIDANSGALLLNYFSGKDVALCTNPGTGGGSNQQGGIVTIGKNLEVGLPTRDVNIATNINAVANNGVNPTGLHVNTFHTASGSYNTRLSVNDGGTKAFVVDVPGISENFSILGDGTTLINTISGNRSPLTIKNHSTNSPVTLFEIANDGSTLIKSSASNNLPSLVITNTKATSSKALVITNPANTADVYRVYNDGTVWATEVNVALSNNFPDYVFDKEYKRLSFSELEKYVKQKKHLPNVPSATEIEKSGLALGEMERIHLEKTEELYLYMIELHQKIEMLVKKNEELEKEVQKLK